MTRYYDRRFEILVDDEVFIGETGGRQFRVTFNILLDFGGFHSYADIRIYNLSDETAAKALVRNNVFTLRAGYQETIDTLFKGRVRNVFKEREGPDTVTRIIARGGSQPEASISRTLGVNTRVTEIISACAQALGYPLVINSDDFAAIPPYPRGYVLNGDPRVYLDSLAQTHNFNYIVDNERLVVTGGNSFRQGEPFIVSQFTGMEGIPEVTEVGCDVNVRLSPKIRIGGRIDVQSELATFNFSNLYFQNVPENAGTGVYNVFRLRHTGDSWGDQWTTQVTGLR